MRRNILPLLLIAAGILWLLFETGVVPVGALRSMWLTWPLLLVGIGLDLLRVPRPWSVPYTALAIVVIVVAAIVSPRGENATQRTTFHEPVGAARNAEVRLDLSSSPSRLAAASDAATLIDAEFLGRPGATVSVRGDATKTISVRPEPTRLRIPTSFGDNRWTIALGSSIPLDLTVNGGSGPGTFDLAGLDLTGLNLDLGSGPTTLTLPASVEGYSTTVKGGSGPTRIDMASGSRLDLSLDMGSGSTDLVLPTGVRGELTVRGGSGPIQIDVPSDTAVRLDVRDDGSGSLRVASFLERRSGSGDTGVWESASVSDAGPTLQITVTDAGSGSIGIR